MIQKLYLNSALLFTFLLYFMSRIPILLLNSSINSSKKQQSDEQTQQNQEAYSSQIKGPQPFGFVVTRKSVLEPKQPINIVQDQLQLDSKPVIPPQLKKLDLSQISNLREEELVNYLASIFPDLAQALQQMTRAQLEEALQDALKDNQGQAETQLAIQKTIPSSMPTQRKIQKQKIQNKYHMQNYSQMTPQPPSQYQINLPRAQVDYLIEQALDEHPQLKTYIQQMSRPQMEGILKQILLQERMKRQHRLQKFCRGKIPQGTGLCSTYAKTTPRYHHYDFLLSQNPFDNIHAGKSAGLTAPVQYSVKQPHLSNVSIAQSNQNKFIFPGKNFNENIYANGRPPQHFQKEQFQQLKRFGELVENLVRAMPSLQKKIRKMNKKQIEELYYQIVQQKGMSKKNKIQNIRTNLLISQNSKIINNEIKTSNQQQNQAREYQLLSPNGFTAQNQMSLARENKSETIHPPPPLYEKMHTKDIWDNYNNQSEDTLVSNTNKEISVSKQNCSQRSFPISLEQELKSNSFEMRKTLTKQVRELKFYTKKSQRGKTLIMLRNQFRQNSTKLIQHNYVENKRIKGNQ